MGRTPESSGAAASGAAALSSNSTGAYNTASGAGALQNNTSDHNTAIGFDALGASTVPIFDANSFSRQNFPRLSDFSFGQDDDSIAAAVEAVLDDPAAARLYPGPVQVQINDTQRTAHRR